MLSPIRSRRGLRVLMVLVIALARLTSVSATSVRPPKFTALVTRADCIVRTETTAVRSEWRGTGDSRHIVTIVTLRVLQRLVGTTTESIELELLGGTVGDRTLHISDQPQFSVGDRDVLFVENNGRQICPLVGMMYGRYPIVHSTVDPNGDLIIRQSGEALESIDDVEKPLSDLDGTAPRSTARQTMTLATFETNIRHTASQLGRKDVTR